MGTPHYHQCTGDCPDGLSAGAVAKSVRRQVLADITEMVGGIEEDATLSPALDFWRAKLATLDRIITEGEQSQFSGVRDAATHLRSEREHLAVLLKALGVEVKGLDEEKAE